MSESRIDPEQLAALLDGRLDERQRAEVMARLAQSPDAFEAYVDAVAIAGEVEGGSRAGAGAGSADVSPLKRPDRTPVRWRVARWQWLAAAVIAGVAVVPLFTGRGDRETEGMDPGAFVDALANENAGLPAGWDGRPWSTTRSAGDPLTPEARAVRIGARLVDLELAVRAGDTAVVAQAAGEVAALLEDIPASGPVTSLYREMVRRADEPSGRLLPLVQRARGAAVRLAGQEMAALGAAIEAARVAAARRDAAFFERGTHLVISDRVERLSAAPPQARVHAARIRSAQSSGGPDSWAALERDLSRLLDLIAD